MMRLLVVLLSLFAAGTGWYTGGTPDWQAGYVGGMAAGLAVVLVFLLALYAGPCDCPACRRSRP